MKMKRVGKMIIIALAALLKSTIATSFNDAFAAGVFSSVKEILTVPWYQGVDQVVAAFGSEFKLDCA